MWTGGILAAEAPTQNSDSLLVLLGGIIIAAMVPLGSVFVEIVKGRNSRTTASPPAPSPFPGSPGAGAPKDVELYERTAALNERFRHNDEENHARDLTLKGHGELLDDYGEDIVRIKRHLGMDDA